jgi:TonB family protein
MFNLPYILEVQLCLALFWTLYRLTLRRSGALGHNRFYLLAAAVAALVIPALSIPVWTPEAPVAQVGVGLPHVQIVQDEAPEGWTLPGWKTLILCIIAIGIAVMSVGVARHAVRMIRSVRRSRTMDVRRARVIFDPQVRSPYSFFRYIFVGDIDAKAGELPQIIAHEMVHIRLGHSCDAVFAQILLILFWWNPFVWAWNRSLKEVHEFQADRAVLKQGFDSKQYITLLLETLAGIHPEFVSGFSYSLIKNRLIMMTKTPGRGTKIRLLAAIPALAAALLLFSFTDKPAQASPVATEQEQEKEKETITFTFESTSADTVSLAFTPPTPAPAAPEEPQTPPAPAPEEPFLIVEEMPRFEGKELNGFRDWAMKQMIYPTEAIEHGIHGRVVASFIIEKDGTLNEIQILSSPDQLLSQEAERILRSSPRWTPGKQRGHLVRVKFTIPIEFSLDGGKPSTPQTSDSIKTDLTTLIHEMQDKKPLFVINENVSNEETFNSLSPDKIESITVLKDGAATEYGEAGKNGVILVKTK